MKYSIDPKVALLAVGVVVGFAAVAAAIVTAHAWSVLIGTLGLGVAHQSGIALAKRLGVTEQPQ